MLCVLSVFNNNIVKDNMQALFQSSNDVFPEFSLPENMHSLGVKCVHILQISQPKYFMDFLLVLKLIRLNPRLS